MGKKKGKTKKEKVVIQVSQSILRGKGKKK